MNKTCLFVWGALPRQRLSAVEVVIQALPLIGKNIMCEPYVGRALDFISEL